MLNSQLMLAISAAILTLTALLSAFFISTSRPVKMRYPKDSFKIFTDVKYMLRNRGKLNHTTI